MTAAQQLALFLEKGAPLAAGVAEIRQDPIAVAVCGHDNSVEAAIRFQKDVGHPFFFCHRVAHKLNVPPHLAQYVADLAREGKTAQEISRILRERRQAA